MYCNIDPFYLLDLRKRMFYCDSAHIYHSLKGGNGCVSCLLPQNSHDLTHHLLE